MPTAALRNRTNVFRWALVLGPVLVLALAFQSLWAIRAATENPDPDDMSVVADRVAQLVDAYLARIAGTTSNLAAVPELVKLAADRSARPVTDADQALEKKWKEGNADENPLGREPVSIFFRDLVSVEGGIYREIFLADARGRLVAASNRTEDYLQNDESWWPKDLARYTAGCRRAPLNCVTITNVEWDPSAAASGYDLVLPVVLPGRDTVGVLKAVIDPHELDALLDLAMLNDRFDVALISAEGKRLLSRDPFFSQNEATAARLRALAPGAETALPLAGPGKEGPVAFVRRLSRPLEGGWSVAVVDRDAGDADAWKASALWFLFTVGMLAVSASAFAVRVQAPEEAPVEQGAA